MASQQRVQRKLLRGKLEDFCASGDCPQPQQIEVSRRALVSRSCSTASIARRLKVALIATWPSYEYPQLHSYCACLVRGRSLHVLLRQRKHAKSRTGLLVIDDDYLARDGRLSTCRKFQAFCNRVGGRAISRHRGVPHGQA